MTDKQKQEAIKAYDDWCEKEKLTLNGVKEIRISRDAWLGCWSFMKDRLTERERYVDELAEINHELVEALSIKEKAMFAIKAIVDNEIRKSLKKGDD